MESPGERCPSGRRQRREQGLYKQSTQLTEFHRKQLWGQKSEQTLKIWMIRTSEEYGGGVVVVGAGVWHRLQVLNIHVIDDPKRRRSKFRYSAHLFIRGPHRLCDDIVQRANLNLQTPQRLIFHIKTNKPDAQVRTLSANLTRSLLCRAVMNHVFDQFGNCFLGWLFGQSRVFWSKSFDALVEKHSFKSETPDFFF